MYSIYKLEDPIDGLVYWVGMTGCLKRRYIQHLQNSIEFTSYHKWSWVAGLARRDLFPLISAIEKVESRKDALMREQFWIQHYLALGMPLTNVLGVGRRVTPLPPMPTDYEPYSCPAQYLLPSEVAQRLGKTIKEVKMLLKMHRIPGFRISPATWRIDGVDLEEYIKQER